MGYIPSQKCAIYRKEGSILCGSEKSFSIIRRGTSPPSRVLRNFRKQEGRTGRGLKWGLATGLCSPQYSIYLVWGDLHFPKEFGLMFPEVCILIQLIDFRQFPLSSLGWISVKKGKKVLVSAEHTSTSEPSGIILASPIYFDFSLNHGISLGVHRC